MKKRILVVDDDPSIRKLLIVNLSAEGYEVEAVENGKEALAFLQEKKVDIIVLDIMMPEKDGWEVCKSIRDAEYETKQKIIILTARDTTRDKMIGKSFFQADEYITKPFDIDELLAVIAKLIKE